ncbi:MAG: segregation/condensation protein A [Anaerolineae bacterium]|nr:segregation/condensation protein A [Anaerolineae bacterium]
MVGIQTLQDTDQTSYEVHTPVFEGPLALLLRLIEKNELDITRVALAQVTDEFMAHVDRMRANHQIETIADFLFVAARLLWIKSRALLPQPPASAKEVDEEDDIGDELLRQLRAYRQYKEAAGWLRDRDHQGLRSYVVATPLPRPRRLSMDLSAIEIEALRDTAEELLYPSESPRPEGALQRVRISILQQISHIRSRLIAWSRVTFRRLLSKEPSRLEAVVTLQAILELMKQRAIDVKQKEMFGDITIEALIAPEKISHPGQTVEDATL